MFIFFIHFNQENLDSKILQIEILFENSFTHLTPILKHCSLVSREDVASLITVVDSKFKVNLENECNQFIVKSQNEDKYEM